MSVGMHLRLSFARECTGDQFGHSIFSRHINRYCHGRSALKGNENNYVFFEQDSKVRIVKKFVQFDNPA
jgi:hypothetical protein